MLATQTSIEATKIYSIHDKINYGFLAGIASYMECILEFHDFYPELVDELCTGKHYDMNKQAKMEFWNIINPGKAMKKNVEVSAEIQKEINTYIEDYYPGYENSGPLGTDLGRKDINTSETMLSNGQLLLVKGFSPRRAGDTPKVFWDVQEV